MKRLQIAAAELAFIALTLGALVAHSAPTLPRDSIYQLDAALTDQAGQAMRFSGLRGRPRVVTMFYTSCQYICPLIVDSVKAIERGLTAQERERVGFALISMDPERDSPAALKKVMDDRKLDPSRWALFRPAEADLRALAGVLGIRYRALSDGEFNHSTMLVLVDAEGRVLARTEKIGSDPEFLAAVHAAAAG
jgi:protein SCO1/2